ncbi:sulfotransferase family protein [Kangiella koreensis]|uniref:Sulfotransferase n=1 Tax=Kangiella koreensis (strain DSM 16069 / JCM 12317 / KCTC 12182 / SW-125) TaxID=523791 RepID=C7RAQ5_KANKD|nr:sulfotransferase [Kangiella koreensis]ACV26347.1 hypothetical protein Kkor_0927 [Kangiella koreensis DSM 16069]
MIFIVGYSRSGTKMMNKVLTKLGITSFIPELHFFEQLYSFGNSEAERNQVLSQFQRKQLIEKLTDIVKRVGDRFDDGRSVEKVLKEFRVEAEELEQPDALRIYRVLTGKLSSPLEVDPTPRNAYYMVEIAEEIPDSRFIYMIRDPRDCILSQRDKWKNYFYNKKRYFEAFRLWVNYNPWLMSRFWRSSYQQLVKSRQKLESRLLCVHYESITDAPESLIPHLERFTGQESISKDMSFIRRGNSQKWKKQLSSLQACMIQRHLGNEIQSEGYEMVDYSWPIRLLSYGLTVFYTVKLPFAFLVNISRLGNLGSMIKRRLLGR